MWTQIRLLLQEQSDLGLLCLFKRLLKTFQKMTKEEDLKSQSQLQQTTNFGISFPIFDKNKVYYMRIVCQQTILMKYHALFVTFEKAAKF